MNNSIAMDQNYLQELILEAKNRGGGMVLNVAEKPEVVVLTIDRYNELLNQLSASMQSSPQQQTAADGVRYSGKKVLVTGGAGYIGSHAVRELLKAGYQVVVLDNLSTGKREHIPDEALFFEGDASDVNLLRDIFSQHKFYAVLHFAASIEVEESVKNPQKYLHDNTLATATLLSVMAEHDVHKIIFSSTAAVYGPQSVMPITETAKVSPDNPYGYSKLLAERLIKYYSHFFGFQSVVFRFFNACGSDFDGKISSTHTSHLIPAILDVASGTRPHITVNGTDYSTVDGTCVRDYVHVLDIARAHVAALEKLDSLEGYRIYNIGTGRGSSVREVIQKVSEVLGKIIPMEKGERRAGDAPETVADNTKIKQELEFELLYSDLETIIRTSWQQRQQVSREAARQVV